MKQDRVSMPMASAGIIGLSPDMKIAGKEIDPKALVLAVAAIVVVVHVANYLLK